MPEAKNYQAAYHQLLQLSEGQGYLLFDDILRCLSDDFLPLDRVEHLCEALTDAGIIIKEKAPKAEDTLEDSGYDRSRLDYAALFEKAISIDPSLSWYIEQLEHIKPPQRNEERSLLPHAREGNPYACERLVEMSLRSTLKSALWFHDKYGLPLDETIQDANIGLLIASKKISSSSDIRFSTYAPWWIRQYVMRVTQGLGIQHVHMPAHVKERLAKTYLLKESHEDVAGPGDSSGLVNIAQSEFELKTEEAVELLGFLDAQVSIEDIQENGVGETISDHNDCASSIMDALFEDDLKAQLRDCLNSLKDRERRVLELRYGLIDGEEHTLEEVGRIFDVTRERIRQIEQKALKRLRHPSRSMRLKEFWIA